RSGRPLIAPLLIRRPPLAPPFPYTTLFRSHVPITTTADVRFQAGGAEIHMAAGECWIFDTWARHRVINNADSTRIHLVADTVGGDPPWVLIARCRPPNRQLPRWRAAPGPLPGTG